MQRIIQHFAGGDALFSGALLLLVAVACSLRPTYKGRGVLIRCLFAVAVVDVGASAVPFPGWFYALWVAVAIAWVVCESRESARLKRWRFALRIAVVLLTVGAPSWEIVWQMQQQTKLHAKEVLYVIGDSISVEYMATEETAWPSVLRRQRRLDVVNLAQSGATARSALQQAEQVTSSDTLVLIEIGGNDLLGRRSTQQFADDLDSLLQELRQPGRRLIMLELPLPPFYNGYGRAQRRLAAKYGVAMIPRREFASIIFADGATVDGLHLTKDGHQLMAEMIWRHVATAFESSGVETE